MKKGRIAGLALTVIICLVLTIAGTQLSQTFSCTMKDTEGNILATICLEQGDYRLDCAESDWAYVDLAFHEAASLWAKEKKLTVEEANRQLVEEDVTIRTRYQKEIQDALIEGIHTSGEILSYDSAGAVSDIEGNLLACYSFSTFQEQKNNVIYPTWAGSTMKPLSVYGPALEEEVICWSSLEEDSPYTQMENEDGERMDWPTNTTEYTYEMKTIAQALKESNNAIAVKTLKKLNVSDSLDWLEKKFGYTIESERQMFKEKEDVHALSNVALGYLEAGVTMKQMLENYQVFATGGIKRELCAVDYIKTKDEIVQSEKEDEEQIFSEETAYIVNRMLKGIVSKGGTGEEAEIEGIDLCGKTGTSLNYHDNWFIGMTPKYLCSIWYSCDSEEERFQNEAVLVCREVFKRLPDQEGLEFACPSTVEKLSYCMKTGLRAGKFCEEISGGYYKKDSFMQVCDCQPASAITNDYEKGGGQ